MKLGNTFAGLGLNAKPSFEDDGEPADGDNDCFSLGNYDEEDIEDPNAPYPQMKPVMKHKYKVGEKEYMVRQCCELMPPVIRSQLTVLLATGGYYQFAINHKGGGMLSGPMLNWYSKMANYISHNWKESRIPG